MCICAGIIPREWPCMAWARTMAVARRQRGRILAEPAVNAACRHYPARAPDLGPAPVLPRLNKPRPVPGLAPESVEHRMRLGFVMGV